jgi:hypothetical protein
MNDDPAKPGVLPEADKPAPRDLAAAARRALAEAEARRARPKPEASNELNGRGGLDPARFGDWEVKGLASDF